jgi:hypothetical protein
LICPPAPRGEGEISLFSAEPTVGSAPPWAGVTPAPNVKAALRCRARTLPPA